MAYKGYTEAHARANKKYMETLAEVKLRMKPEEKEQIKAAADKAGESLNGYITTAVAQRMERDTQGG